MRKKILSTLVFSCMALLLSSSPAMAHKARIFAYVEGGNIHTESGFARGKKAMNCPVTVLNSNGETILIGTTNDQGLFTFKAPSPDNGDLTLVLNAGEGHRGEWKINSSEYAGQSVPEQPESTAEPRTANPVATTPGISDPSATNPEEIITITASELQDIINVSLDKKLAPIHQSLAEIKNKDFGPTEIAGGIGFIIGLGGLLAFASSRRKDKSAN